MAKEITFDKFIRWTGIVLIIGAVLFATNYLSSVLLPFFIAWFFAYLLYPVVKFIENKLHVKVRALSIIIAMLLAIGVIGGVIWMIIPPMIDQFDKLGDVLTKWLYQQPHSTHQGLDTGKSGTNREIHEEQGFFRCHQECHA